MSDSSGETVEDLVEITFRFHTTREEVELRFPVFWGPQRYPRSIRMEDRGGYLEATVMLPRQALVRYQYGVPGLSYDEREQFRPNLEVNRYVYADAGKTIVDEAYVYGLEPAERPATLSGRVTDASGDPVLQAVVVADGILTLTVDGYYEVAVRDRDLSLTVFMLDGSLRPWSGTVRPGDVDVTLARAAPATVRLHVDAQPPEHHAVRLFASPSQLGARILVGNILTRDSFVTVDGPLELQLHEGQWVDYLYSVGNVNVSYEQEGGAWVVRSFVATDGLAIHDVAGSFVGAESVNLTVEVPPYTGEDDLIGVDDVQPLPLFMHRRDAHTWVLTMSHHGLTGRPVSYYKTYPGTGREVPVERTISTSDERHVVTAWLNHDAPIPDYEVDEPVFTSPFAIFAYPADFYNGYHDLHMERQIRRFHDLGYHGVQLTDAWGGYVRLEPTPRIIPHEPLPAYTPIDALRRWTSISHELGMEMLLEPQLGGGEHLLAQNQVFDEDWWRAWLPEIERFNMQMARVAQWAQIDYLVFTAKLPGFIVPQPFVPEYNAGLAAIIDRMREVYGGRIIVRYEEWVDGVDYHSHGDVVMQVVYGLGMDTSDPTQEEVDAAVERLFVERYGPQHLSAVRPMWISLGYQSVDGQVMGHHAPEVDGPHTLRNQDYPLDLDEQRMIYEAFYRAAGRREWLMGFSLFGYGFTDVPLARDVSINGKPAETLSSRWAQAMRSQ